MKKEYEKPILTDSDTFVNFVPALALGGALLGGYAAGRAVKEAFDARENALVQRPLERVEKV